MGMPLASDRRFLSQRRPESETAGAKPGRFCIREIG
jgi:hypothetical protein